MMAMEQWRSLDEIAKDFDLPEGCSHAIARAGLMKLLADIHPDRTSGEFLSANDEEHFHRILHAIKLVDEWKTKTSSIVPYTERPAPILAAAREVRADEAAFRVEITKTAKSKYYRQKVGSAIIGGALLACLMFSDKLVSNPLVSHLFSYVDERFTLFRPVIGVIFLLGIIIASGVLTTAWRRENRAKMMTEALLTDSGISELFTSYPLYYRISDTENFSSKDLVEAIQLRGNYTRRRLPALLPSKLRKVLPHLWRYHKDRSLFAADPVLAQHAADLVLEKLQLRGAVLPIPSGALFGLYQLSAEARKGLENERGF
jgi:hypothetical protein